MIQVEVQIIPKQEPFRIILFQTYSDIYILQKWYALSLNARELPCAFMIMKHDTQILYCFSISSKVLEELMTRDPGFGYFINVVQYFYLMTNILRLMNMLD